MVGVFVAINVPVGVTVGVPVGNGVTVGLDVAVWVGVDVGAVVGVGVGGRDTTVFRKSAFRFTLVPIHKGSSGSRNWSGVPLGTGIPEIVASP